MKRESSARDCPFCDAKGITKGEICDVCKGVKKIVIRYNPDTETREKDIELFDTVCETIKEEIRDNNNG